MSVYEQLRAGEYEANPPLDAFELLVLNALISSADEAHQARNNGEVAQELEVSRNAISRARQRLTHKIDIIPAGF